MVVMVSNVSYSYIGPATDAAIAGIYTADSANARVR